MGDTGSLALGGFVASTAYMLQMPFFIAIVGLIYLIEVLSVMIQVTYFKRPESAFLKWRQFIITLNFAAGQRRGLWLYFRLLRQSYVSLHLWRYRKIQEEQYRYEK
ncbi:MAG: hypothetical protein ACLTCI_04170 [[Clostridium] nexile]